MPLCTTTVVRQAKNLRRGRGVPLERGFALILGLGSAGKGAANRDLVSSVRVGEPLSRRKWVPALLEGVWKSVSATLHEFLKKTSRPY